MPKPEITEKEFMDGMHSDANAGTHRHLLFRNELSTLTDGYHRHWFLIPTQESKTVIATTAYDGFHAHSIENPNDSETQDSKSAHKHVVYISEDVTLNDGTELKAGEVFVTEKDGEHVHGANGLHYTDSDGFHQHVVQLTPKVRIKSLNVEQIVELMLFERGIDVVAKEEKTTDQNIDDDRAIALGLLGYKVEKQKKKKQYQLDKQTEIQSLVFPKGKFTLQEAKRWVENHDRFNIPSKGVDETETSFRFRQKDPDKFKRMRTITLPDSGGVKAVVGVRKEDVEKELDQVLKSAPTEIAIAKADDEKRVVYGVVLEPDVIDAQGDTISSDEIEKAAHRFLKESRMIKFRHKKEVKKAAPVESFIAPQSLTYSGPNGKQKVKKGSWVLGIHVDDERLWAMVKKKELNAFSIGAEGLRTPLS